MPEAYLTPEDVKKIEEGATCLRDRLLIHLLFDTGCRISEALALEPKDIDLARGTMTIQHLKASVRLLCPGCGGRLARRYKFCPICASEIKGVIEKELERHRMRVIPFSPDTRNMLREYIDRGGVYQKNGKALLFGVTRTRAWQIVKDLAEKAGVGRVVNPETGEVHHVSPHKLRDAFAVMAVQADDSTDGMLMLQLQLGHVSFNTTAKYRKVRGQELKEWHQRIKGIRK